MTTETLVKVVKTGERIGFQKVIRFQCVKIL